MNNNHNPDLIHREALGASLRAILLSTTKWSKLAEESQFSAGYWEGVIDTLEQIGVMYQIEMKLPELSIKWEANPEWEATAKNGLRR